MALNGQSTSNFELYKPSLADSPPDITSTNPNWDKIDAELKRLGDNGLPNGINKKLPTAVTSTEVREIYLSPNGDDTADGTSTNPLKTIATAISRFGGMARLILHFASGTYVEANAVEASGVVGVEFFADEGSNVTLNLHYYQHGGYFNATRINFVSSPSTTYNTLTFYGVTALIDYCTFSVKNGAVAFRNGSAGCLLRTDFSNCGYVVYAMGGSTVAAQEITGSGNTNGYYCTGSLIMVGTSSVTATTLATKVAGGVIFRNGTLIGSTANTFVNAT